MIGFFLLPFAVQAAPTLDGLPIGAIAKQEMPAHGCAAFLWTLGANRALIGMASADPAQLRLSIDGASIDVPRVAQEGAGGFGFGATTRYEAGGLNAVLDMSIVTRDDLKDGAAVQDATLRIDRAGRDGVAIPVNGIVGCTP